MKKVTDGHNLLSYGPELVAEWHHDKNKPLEPSDVAPNSGKKVWWTCKRGHEWEARISSRTRGHGCPFCSGSKVSNDHNLAILYPEIAAEWHVDKNTLNPWEVMPRSARRAWWICRCGHEWEESICNRTGGRGCPRCTKAKNIRRKSLASHNPDLANEWHILKNGELSPSDVTCATKRQVWWKCENGHEWRASVCRRVRGFGKCLACRSLAAKFPNIAAQWSSRNTCSPYDLLPHSGKKAWWKCAEGHEWHAPVCDRTNGHGCPFCCGRAVSFDNSLAALFPHLVASWHSEKNGELTAWDITSRSGRRVWWRCSQGHEWRSRVADRAAGSGCPVCSGLVAAKDNNFAVRYPELASEWHPARNGALKPSNVMPMSNKKVWWICPNGHEYTAQICERSRKDCGCPKCVKRISRKGSEWLDSLGVPDDEKHREVRRRVDGHTYILDGFDPETNTIYEFLGDYWHGNPGRYGSSDMNRRNKRAFGDLFAAMLRKFVALSSEGYLIRYRWESSNVVFQFDGLLRY